jgi:hypothetical protein
MINEAAPKQSEVSRMPAEIVRLLPRQKFDFAAISGKTSVDMVVVSHVDVSAFMEATLLVRVHEQNIVADGTIKLWVQPEAPTTEEPGTDFAVDGSEVVDFGEFNAGDLAVVSLGTNLGGWVRFRLVGSGDYNPPPDPETPFNVTFSMDLVLKS